MITLISLIKKLVRLAGSKWILRKGKGDYMQMYVPFCYEKMGRIEVEANSVEEAQGKAQDILDEMSWKDCGRLAECVDDSAQIDYDGIILDENQNIVEAD